MSSPNHLVPSNISEDSASPSDQSQDGSSESSLETEGKIVNRQKKVPQLAVINESDSTSSSDQLQRGSIKSVASLLEAEDKTTPSNVLPQSECPSEHDRMEKDNSLLVSVNGTTALPTPAKKKEDRGESGDKKIKRKPKKKEKETTTDETIYPKDTSSSDPRSTDDSNTCTLPSSREKTVGQYLHADSLRISDGSTGMHILGSLVRGTGSVDYSDMSIQEIIHGLTRPDWHMHHASLREALLLERLPRALETQNVADAAECLTACDPDVQDRAVSCLERLLLVKRDEYRSAESLVRVMNTTTSMIFTDYSNTSHLLRLVYLFLLAACDLLQTCRPPSDLQRSITLVKENFRGSVEGKRKISKQLECAQHICEALIEAGISMDSFQKEQWLCVGESHVYATCKSTDKKLKELSLATLFLRFYSHVFEMIKLGWSHMIEKLAQEVSCVHREVCRRKMDKHIRLTFEIFGLRCLALVLSTTLNKDVQQVQGRTSDSPSKLVALVRQIVLYSRKKDTLLSEVRGLLFHPCVKVREAMVDLMTQCDQELSDAFLKYINTRLRLAGIRVCCGCDLSSDNKIKQSRKKDCEWLDMKCLGNAGGKLKVTVHVPKKSCLGRNPFYTCKEEHQRSRHHEQNLEMLLNLNPHPNIISLHAFQSSPWPYFYITEDASELRLLHLLLDRRKLHQWLPSNILSQAALDVISALDFLDGQKIVLRDITTFNMTYQMLEGTSQNGGDITSIQVKIADLGLTKKSSCQENSYENPDVTRIFDAGPVPTRWTSVEALCNGEFSSKSMIYALGYVLYELFTHGCQPFSEMQGRSLEDILTLVVMAPDGTRPFRWACFPPEIFDLLRSCTARAPEERPSLPQVKRKLHEFLQGPTFKKLKVEVPSPTQMWRRGQEYPLLDTEQIKRNHVPERGIPGLIKDLVNGQTKYKNLMPDYWESQKSNKVNEELYSSDPITIRTQEDGLTSVEEVLMPYFVEHFLPILETSGLESIVCWTFPRLHIQSDHAVQERHYESAVRLTDAARMHLLTSPGEDDDDINLHTCLAVARCVCKLHQENWLYRDLKASNILITQQTGKVILARIGRMVHLAEREFVREKDMVFTDSLRWLSPEALHLNVYTKENDIFMLGTVFWETYNIRQVCSRNPVATEKNLVPFPDKTKKEVMQLIQEGLKLPKVPDMPEWLYELVGDCRHPDKEKRPTISDIITRLGEHWPPVSDDEKIRLYRYCVAEASPSSFGKRLGFFMRQTLRRKTLKRSVSKTRDNTHHPYINYSRNEENNDNISYSGESESFQNSAGAKHDTCLDLYNIDEDEANAMHLPFSAILKKRVTKPLRSLYKAFLPRRKRKCKTMAEICEKIYIQSLQEQAEQQNYDEPESVAYFPSQHTQNISVPKMVTVKNPQESLTSTVTVVMLPAAREKMPLPPLPEEASTPCTQTESKFSPSRRGSPERSPSPSDYKNILLPQRSLELLSHEKVVVEHDTHQLIPSVSTSHRQLTDTNGRSFLMRNTSKDYQNCKESSRALKDKVSHSTKGSVRQTEQTSSSNKSQRHYGNIFVSQTVSAGLVPEMGSADMVVEQCQNYQNLSPLPSQSLLKKVYTSTEHTNCMMQYSQPYEDRQNRIVSSRGDEVSPLHIKHKGKIKPEPDEHEYEEYEVSEDNILSSDDRAGATDDANQQDEGVSQQVTCPVKYGYLTPVAEDLHHDESSVKPSHSPSAQSTQSTTDFEQTETDTESKDYINCES